MLRARRRIARTLCAGAGDRPMTPHARVEAERIGKAL